MEQDGGRSAVYYHGGKGKRNVRGKQSFTGRKEWAVPSLIIRSRAITLCELRYWYPLASDCSTGEDLLLCRLRCWRPL